jgi:cation diffusion facilitator family transporter
MEKNVYRIGIIAAFASIVLNALLFGGKYYAGLTSNSVALMADAWHTLTDSISSVIVLAGIYIAGRPPDKKRPFGYGNFEFVVSIIIGLLLVLVGFDFLLDSFDKLKTGERAEYSSFAVLITAATIIIKELMAQYSFYAARKINSKSLKADAWHHRSDAFTSVVILAGIFIQPYLWWIDAAMGAIVCAVIFHAAYEIIKEAVKPILGESPEQGLIDKLSEIGVKTTGRDLLVHHCHVHRYGHHTELTCHICLPGEWSLDKAHSVADALEHQVAEQMGISLTVHIDPIDYGRLST